MFQPSLRNKMTSWLIKVPSFLGIEGQQASQRIQGQLLLEALLLVLVEPIQQVETRLPTIKLGQVKHFLPLLHVMEQPLQDFVV